VAWNRSNGDDAAAAGTAASCTVSLGHKSSSVLLSMNGDNDEFATVFRVVVDGERDSTVLIVKDAAVVD
jgi:hypothetical protein